mgnify:FL=1|jgi:type I restriction enzyme S subunit
MANVSSSNGLEKRPKIRFPGFDEPWRAEKLSDFAERITRKNSNNETDLPLTISSKDGLVDQISYFNKTVASKDMSGYYLLRNGEYAYNKSYSVGYDFGSIKRLDRYPMGALSTLYICFALKKHNTDFIKVYFDSLKWYKEIYMISAEGARNHGLLNVPTDEFFATKHYLPENTAEQRKIADFLIALERRIDAQQSLVDNLKKYKRGLIKLVFEKVMSEAHYQLPLSDLCISISSGRTTVNESNGRYPLFGSTGIVGMTNTIEHDGDIVMVARVGANAGKVNFFSGRCGVTDNTLVIRVKENTIHPKFLAYFLENFDLHKLIFGSGQPLVTGGQLKKIQSPVIAYKAQLLITRSLESLDRIIGTQDTYMEKLIQLKSGLMQRLFI